MRYLSILAALILTASASKAATVNLNLTPEEGGTKTRLSWSYTGTPTMVPVNDGPTKVTGLGFASGNASSPPYWSVSGTLGTAFTASIPTLTGLNTGLTLTNTTTNQSYGLSQIAFSPSDTSYILFTWPDANFTSSYVGMQVGQVIELSGPTSGSILTDIAYSNFNEGTWTLDQALYSNFDTVLTVGVPEPTSALLSALGATILLRRRR